MRKLVAAASVAAILVIAACNDRSKDFGLTAPRRSMPAPSFLVLGGCTNVGALKDLAGLVFGPGSPSVNSVVGKLNNLDKKVKAGDVAGAQSQAQNIVDFVRSKAAEGRLAGTSAQIDQFIGGVLCFAGLSPDTFLIQPTDQPQIITNAAGNSGVALQGNTVNVPTLLTFTTLNPNGPSPLITKLDQYPTYLEITTSSQITKPADVGICLAIQVRTSIFNRLRLGHQRGPGAAGFEITAPPSVPVGNIVNCPASLASASRLPGWMHSLAGLVLPRVLYARQDVDPMRGGGVGGSATEFSPFDAVDPELSARGGGVGGSATEFQIKPGTNPNVPGLAKPEAGAAQQTVKSIKPGVRLNTLSGDGLTCTEVAATVGTQLEALCRPVLTIKTFNGTSMENVPVNWSVASGGGRIAPWVFGSASCGTFGTTAATTTNVDGRAAICWEVGPDGGTNNNTVTAAPNFGGDAPAGVNFNPASKTAAASGLKITPTITATGEVVAAFDGLNHPGLGTCSNFLTPALTYDQGGGVPINAGSYTLTVKCGTGSTVYNEVTATAAITIGMVTPVVSVSCPVSVVFDGTAQTPCSATVTAPGGLSQTPTPVYTNNQNAGTANAAVSFAAIGNYAAAAGNASFLITVAPSTTAVSCSPASVVYTGSALTPCAVTVTGAGGLNLTPLPGYSNNIDVGTAGASYTYTGDPNHSGSTDSKTFSITVASSTTLVTCPAGATYTGAALTPCSAAVTGAGGLSLTPTPSYTDNINVGTANASYSFAGDANHAASADAKTFAINVASSTTAVSCPASQTYTGGALTPCSATVTGAGGLSLTPTPSYSLNTNVGTANASYSFAGDLNHAPSSDAKPFAITPAPSTTLVACVPTSVPYTGSPRTPCAASVSGVGGLSVAGITPNYSNNVNAGTAGASYLYGGDANHSGSSGSTTFSITQVSSATAVSCPASATFTGAPVTPCTAAVTGANLSLTPTPNYSNNTSIGTANANYTFSGDVNHTGSSDAKTFLISGYVKSACFAAPVSATKPPTSVYVRKGTAVIVKCTLRNASGALITDATGSLLVQDRGRTGITTAGTTVLSVASAFTKDVSGNYVYSLSTSPTNMIADHYFFITAVWKDGTTTTGWFLLEEANHQ